MHLSCRTVTAKYVSENSKTDPDFTHETVRVSCGDRVRPTMGVVALWKPPPTLCQRTLLSVQPDKFISLPWKYRPAPRTSAVGPPGMAVSTGMHPPSRPRCPKTNIWWLWASWLRLDRRAATTDWTQHILVLGFSLFFSRSGFLSCMLLLLRGVLQTSHFKYDKIMINLKLESLHNSGTCICEVLFILWAPSNAQTVYFPSVLNYDWIRCKFVPGSFSECRPGG